MYDFSEHNTVQSCLKTFLDRECDLSSSHSLKKKKNRVCLLGAKLDSVRIDSRHSPRG